MEKKLITRLGTILLIAVLGFSSMSRMGGQSVQGAQASPNQAENVFGVEFTRFDDAIALSDSLIAPPVTETKWIRGIHVFWADVEPSRGARVWSALGETVARIDKAVAGGMTPIVIVKDVPVWARPVETVNYECSPIAEAEFGSFATFVDDLMSHPDSPLEKYDLKYWEIFNEPDVAPNQVDPEEEWPSCWGDPDDEYFGGETYARMLQEVYPIVKTNDPQAQVLLGGLLLDCDPARGPVCDSAKFLEGVLVNGGANDGGDYFDGVSFHSFDYYYGILGGFGNPNWHSAWNTTGPSMAAQAGYLKDLLTDYGYGDKFLMNTESALLHCEGCSSDQVLEQTKAYYLAQAYAMAIAEGLWANIWFDVRGDWERANGLIALKGGAPLPAYYAYQFASRQLADAQYLNDITVYNGVSGYGFTVGSKVISVVWSRDGDPHTIKLPEVPSAIYEVDGDPLPALDTITVSLMPLYIETQASINRAFIQLPLVVNNYRTLGNGDFEAGATGWALVNNGMPAQVISSNQGETIGSRALLLGNPNYSCTGVPIGYAEARQSFSVPFVSVGGGVQLRFKYVVYTQDTTFDHFGVYVNSEVNPTFLDRNSTTPLSCDKLYRIPGPDNPRNGRTTGWATGSVDLSSYSGQNVTVSFRNYNTNDQNYNTYTYVDDVELLVDE